jgi:DNA repair protein RecN (Recombination protein N)
VLSELHIENYAVVAKLRVRFGNGLNVLTGETGSGKSIVVDALDLLFGGRASANCVRSGAERARISGVFAISAETASRLADLGLELDGDDLILEREVLAEGKSRAFAMSRPVTVGLLRDLAPLLGDIHGQHEQQRLFSAEAQLHLVDGFAGIEDLRRRTGGAYREWRAAVAELEELVRGEAERLRMFDLWAFQRDEIDAAGLKPGEDAALEAECTVLQNVGRLLELGSGVYDALYDAEDSASAHVRASIKRLQDGSRYDAKLEEIAAALKPAQIAIDEASSLVRDYLGRLEADPARLDEVEHRLAAIDKLRRKYGATVEEILLFSEQVASQIAAVESSTERRTHLEQQQSVLRQRFERLANDLTKARRSAAAELSEQVMKELCSLAMERTVFEVRVAPAPASPSGLDGIAFYVSANAGEDPRPMEQVASGGELSRIALALKACTATVESGRTLVFDEVDAGIGGAAAESVGRRLKAIAGSNQVLCVTHLAQIAGFADHHFSVSKREVNGRTVAQVAPITGEERVHEIGRMLAGSRLTPEALRHAEQLIRPN